MHLVLLSRFISDTMHFISCSRRFFASSVARAPPDLLAASSPPSAAGALPQASVRGQRDEHAQGSARTGEAEAACAPARVIEVTLTQTMITIPVNSWSHKSFGIFVPSIQLVPSADMQWVNELVTAVKLQCAPAPRICSTLLCATLICACIILACELCSYCSCPCLDFELGCNVTEL